MHILVTGGLGYIGSHTVTELLQHNHEVTVLDNLCNSSIEVKNSIEELTQKQIAFYQINLCSFTQLEQFFNSTAANFDCCIHFASLKAVGESVQKPLEYYENNLVGTINLLKLLKQHHCTNFIFSSSATVYNPNAPIPYTEETPTGGCTNPYGWSKFMIEQFLMDIYKSDPSWNIVLLRYFNPVGAHKSGKLGEKPNGIPNNLMPYITQVAAGKREKLHVFGNDYDTTDGTGVRDYIHVLDLANGHLKALQVITNKEGLKIYNLGTGKGHSVLEMVKTFENINNVTIPYEIAPRRYGDIAIYYASAQKAQQELGWTAKHTLEEMCQDAWVFEKKYSEKL